MASGPSSSESGGRNLGRVALYAAGAVAAGVAIYHFTKKRQPSGPLSTIQLTRLKEEGNVHFAQKRYADAIACFTKVIEQGDFEKDADIIAVAYQNRAASKQLSGTGATEELVKDCANAIELKPDYGRAYARRAQLLKGTDCRQALADSLTAGHIDEKFGNQLMPIMAELMQSLEQYNQEQLELWRRELADATPPQPVTHDQVFGWLYKTVNDEAIRRAYLDAIQKNSFESPFEKALEAIHKRDFVEAFELADRDATPQSALLTARLAFYQGDLEKFEQKLIQFTSCVGDDQSLHEARAVLGLQSAKNKEELIKMHEDSVARFGDKTDFYSSAAYRAVYLDAWEEANAFLKSDKFTPNSITEILNHFVDVNLVVLKGDNPMDAFKVITKLEKFVDDLGENDEHKNWGALALAKIYQTFNNTNNAEVLIKELIRREPSWSVYPTALAHVYVHTGDLKKAVEACDSSLKIEPLNPEAYLLKASLHLHSQGNKLTNSKQYEDMLEEAQSLIQRCVSNADFPFASEVLRHKSFIEAKTSAARSLGL